MLIELVKGNLTDTIERYVDDTFANGNADVERIKPVGEARISVGEKKLWFV